jgi:hypothetical protein
MIANEDGHFKSASPGNQRKSEKKGMGGYGGDREIEIFL